MKDNQGAEGAKKKRKKQKTVYVDDGRTIADMSAFGTSKEPTVKNTSDRELPRWRQILQTYFDSVRLMLLPMLAFLGILALAFFIVWLLYTLA